MKRIVPFLLFLFSLTCPQVIAQIQITVADAPVVGDVFVQSADTSVTLYSIGESGPNRVWDFRSLIANSSDTLRFIATGDAPKNELFPDASFAGQIDSIYTFAEANDQGLYFLGIVSDFFDVDTFFALRFDPNPRLLAYPTTSTTAYVDTSKFDVSALSDIFPDSVRITQEEFNHVNVDAFGTLRMPSGDFDVLRQERMVITFDTIEVLNNGVWLPIEQGVDTIFTYEWLAKEAKGPVLTITTTAAGRITDVDFISNIIPNIPAPAAAFDIEDREDGSFRFVDRSTNEPLSWSWDFGDGNTSTEQNPVHTYTNGGTFNVCLTASNSTGSNTACQAVEVFLPPAAAFDIDTIGNGTFAFNDLSTNTPLSWAWDFGDGSTSDLQNPMHTYSIPGTFNICLNVINEVGENTICQSLTVVLIPVSNFEIVENGAGSFQFNDLSTNNPDAWVWTFGDGNMSNEQSPSHTYDAPGSYEVCLTAANEVGSTQSCQMISVLFAPLASFDIDTLDNGLYGFTDLSTNTPSSWAWDFGDGNTSTAQNPTHTFTTAGTFNICLTASNAAGDNTACQSLTVVLSPQASFTATMGDNGNYTFTDQSTNEPTEWAWDFGDGNTSTEQNPTHTFAATGDFEVCLMVTNAAGSSNTCQTISVIINNVNDPELEAALSVFPNPVSDVLQIQLQDQGTEGVFLQVIGLNGQTQVRQAIQGQTTLQVRNWAAGHYTAILYASTGAIIGRKQFVVSR